MILGQWQVGARARETRRCRRKPDAPAPELAIGYWWCQVCEKPVDLNVDGPANVCAQCGSPRVRWIGGDR